MGNFLILIVLIIVGAFDSFRCSFGLIKFGVDVCLS